MPLITWGPTLQVGFGDIDVQHRRLVDLLNTLHDAFHGDRDREVLGQVVSELVRYARLHFSYEEHLMRRHGLADDTRSRSHVEEHQELTKSVADVQTRYLAGEQDLTEELLEFLKDWLEHHILGTDRGLALALVRAGAVSAA